VTGRPHALSAYTANDTFHHIDRALSPIHMDLAAFFPPVTSSVLRHERDLVHAACQPRDVLSRLR
jgi:hypothetical protein